MNTKTNIGDVISVISNNSSDVLEVIDKFGGIGNVLKAAPAIYRIFDTISKRHPSDPAAGAADVEKMLYYNSATKERVRAFQKAHGLEADGLVGNQTWRKVEELISR